MTKFDVVFCDVTAPKPYELQTLAVEGLGGTEATMIRLAEGLGSLGLKVAVLEHNLEVPLTGKNAYYLPLKYIDEIKCDNYISLRGCYGVEKFANARKFSLHQDVPTGLMSQMRPKFLEHDITVVAVSKWHKHAIQDLICDPNDVVNPRVVYCYNPVPDSLFVPKDVNVNYYPDKLVWPASPHKGLDRAIGLVGRAIDVSSNNKLRLHVFNPGYFGHDVVLPHYVINHGPVPCAELWQHMSESLCVFYPTAFKETFGCIAAEANAVHTPVLTHRLAALSETVAGKRQFVDTGDRQIIEKLLQWNQGERPEVYGQDKFRLSEVLKQWIRMFQ